jgi:exonuclease VII small subunit
MRARSGSRVLGGLQLYFDIQGRATKTSDTEYSGSSQRPCDIMLNDLIIDSALAVATALAMLLSVARAALSAAKCADAIADIQSSLHLQSSTPSSPLETTVGPAAPDMNSLIQRVRQGLELLREAGKRAAGADAASALAHSAAELLRHSVARANELQGGDGRDMLFEAAQRLAAELALLLAATNSPSATADDLADAIRGVERCVLELEQALVSANRGDAQVEALQAKLLEARQRVLRVTAHLVEVGRFADDTE